MSKTEADNLFRLELWRLLRVVGNHIYSTVTVSYGDGRVECHFEMRPDYQHVILHYQIIGDDETPKEMKYSVPLVTTPCHFGGERYWFLCTMYKSGERCNRRVGVLYLAGDYFACRHCYELAYESQNESHARGIFRWVKLRTKLDKLAENVKRYTWRGRLTRKYRKYLAYEAAVNGGAQALADSGFLEDGE